jgi:hypothetical protein
MYAATAAHPSLKLLAKIANGITIAELSGDLDIAIAPALREPFLSLPARSMLSALGRHPLTHSPAVAATATRPRQVLNPASGPAAVLRS